MTTIASIQKNQRETLQVDLTEFRGHNLVALRVWIPSSDGDGMRPTQKGVTVAVTLLPAILEALHKAHDEARRLGLIEVDHAE